ncbi:hypothetical protein HX109_06435 [Galbibacter sp. BG1]|uniref:hypothetical protein n=1 Tax=Galbibacter sp. BG1 TaxID=1170699 RepID=UPI0015C0AAA6|nr:hypothetical protein [Galbibacter sp. BG1]QLE01218.1 hypothetical protein HX109_06435 [Galbibacter sp. BG1]
MNKIVLFSMLSFMLISCSNEKNEQATTTNKLIVKLQFDKNQERLDNFGNPATIADGNAAQTPTINAMSAHYIELAPTATTLLTTGEIIYQGETTTKGGEEAIDFSKSILVKDNETFLEIPLSQVKTGNYEWVRISASYQNGSINLLNNGEEYTGTVASFLGYNMYIDAFDLNGKSIEVNDNKLQGFWGFEAEGYTLTGQAPEGSVTVPNPLSDSSPIPPGSCVLTGKFDKPLQIDGNETENVVITLSFSINNSFEWTEINKDGKYEPAAGENLIDMGLRGLKIRSNQ